jgi:LPS export ABC transporter protein LptC
MNRLLLPILVLLVVVLGALSFRRGPSTQNVAANGQEPPRYTVHTARWQRFDSEGKPMFEATADSIEYFDDESAELHTLELTALGGGDGDPWRASAPSGHSPANEHRVQLTGGVTGKGHWPDGEPLEFSTPDLWLDPTEKRLDTAAKVVIKSPTRAAEAVGLHVDGEHSTIHLLNDVRIRYVAS